jgi:hypothetical protein
MTGFTGLTLFYYFRRSRIGFPHFLQGRKNINDLMKPSKEEAFLATEKQRYETMHFRY